MELWSGNGPPETRPSPVSTYCAGWSFGAVRSNKIGSDESPPPSLGLEHDLSLSKLAVGSLCRIWSP